MTEAHPERGEDQPRGQEKAAAGFNVRRVPDMLKIAFKDVLRRLRVLPPEPEATNAERVYLGRPLAFDELFSVSHEEFEASERAFWDWLTEETVDEYDGQWVVFTPTGFLGSAKKKIAARRMAESQGLGLLDCTVRQVSWDLLRDASHEEM